MYDFILYSVEYSTDILLHWPHICGSITVLTIRPVFSHFYFVLPRHSTLVAVWLMKSINK